MTLPYPYEVETGRLDLRRVASPGSFDLLERIGDLVRLEGNRLVLAGSELSVPPGQSTDALASRYRSEIARRFLARRPNADEHTWRRFVPTVQAMLSDETDVRSDTLPRILSLIDAQ